MYTLTIRFKKGTQEIGFRRKPEFEFKDHDGGTMIYVNGKEYAWFCVPIEYINNKRIAWFCVPAEGWG